MHTAIASKATQIAIKIIQSEDRYNATNIVRVRHILCPNTVSPKQYTFVPLAHLYFIVFITIVFYKKNYSNPVHDFPVYVTTKCYCIVLHCIASYRIVSYRIVSYRIVSYRIVSYRIVSYRIVFYSQHSQNNLRLTGDNDLMRGTQKERLGQWFEDGDYHDNNDDDDDTESVLYRSKDD